MFPTRVGRFGYSRVVENALLHSRLEESAEVLSMPYAVGFGGSMV
jgi:hypothetical protein